MPGTEIDEQEAIARCGHIIWWMIALLLIAVGSGCWIAKLSLSLLSGAKAILVITLCVALSYYYRRWRHDRWISMGAESSAQLAMIMMFGMLLAYPLAAGGFPYRDAELNAIDSWMGLDWRAYLHFLDDHRLIALVAKAAYWSMGAQALFVIAALTASSHFLRLRQYVMVVAVSLALTLAIFAFVPVAGAYVHLNIAPEDYASLHPSVTLGPFRHIEGIRSGGKFLISADDLEGLVAFPSFHTVCGLVFAWALFPLRKLRWWAVSLNIILIASAPIEGAHYFVDLIGGFVVAVLAISGVVLLTTPTWSARPAVAGSLLPTAR